MDVIPLLEVEHLLNDLLITNECVCLVCTPNCESCLYCLVQTRLATWAVSAPSAGQQLINALRIYKDHDECVCDPCIDPGCQGCMYCIAHTALVAIGYIEQEDMQQQQEAEAQQYDKPSSQEFS